MAQHEETGGIAMPVDEQKLWGVWGQLLPAVRIAGKIIILTEKGIAYSHELLAPLREPER